MVFFGRFAASASVLRPVLALVWIAGRNWTFSTMAPKSSTAKDPDIHKASGSRFRTAPTRRPSASDVVAETLSALDIPYIALNPGASYRGLHDSIVNFLGKRAAADDPLLARRGGVAIAHGYAKVTGKAMGAAVHSNVGLFHATMAIFNAWCDRMPILILGATGPVDAMKRRPLDRLDSHRRRPGAIIRNFSKWDDQPASAGAARESVLRPTGSPTRSRAVRPTSTSTPRCRRQASCATAPIDAKRYMPPMVQGPSADLVKQAVDMLLGAKKPLISPAGCRARKLTGSGALSLPRRSMPAS